VFLDQLEGLIEEVKTLKGLDVRVRQKRNCTRRPTEILKPTGEGDPGRSRCADVPTGPFPR